MAKRCTRCGNFLMDDERFCTRCGENVSSIPPEGGAQYVSGNYQQPPQQQYVNTTGQTTGQAPYTYAPPPVQAKDDEMSLGKWVLTIIVTTFFSLISIIFLFVWGFGDGPESRKRYCKAMLIVKAIEIVLAILLSFIWVGIFGAIFGSLADYIDQAQRYQYGAVTVMQMLGM